MNPLSQFIGGSAKPAEGLAPAEGSRPEITRAALAALLRAQRRAPERLPEALAAQLGLSAFQAVLARRAGAAASGDATQRYMEALANNLPLRRVLCEAARALGAAGVRAIVYKGQDYLERIYGDLGGRAMADVDLLVPEAELARAEQALLAAGFIADRACRLMHERKFCKHGVAIDLHHALLQPARMAIVHEELFARALPCRFAPGAFVLDPTDALLVHCVNQTVKGYHLPGSSYLELQVLLAGADIATALARAAAYRAQSALYCSLRALAGLGHEQAGRLAMRVGLSRARRRLLDRTVVPFAMRSIQRDQPARATLLAVKATLIDEPLAVARFVPQWFAWQLPLKPPRPLVIDRDPRAPPPPFAAS